MLHAVQTMKAGLMEIGDIFVINKSDREGSDALGVALRTMLHLKMTKESDRQVPVVKTVASQNKGTDELYEYILMHKEYLEKKGMLQQKRKEHLVKQINELVNNRLENKFWTADKKASLENSLDRISNREVTPYDFVDELFQKS